MTVTVKAHDPITPTYDAAEQRLGSKFISCAGRVMTWCIMRYFNYVADLKLSLSHVCDVVQMFACSKRRGSLALRASPFDMLLKLSSSVRPQPRIQYLTPETWHLTPAVKVAGLRAVASSAECWAWRIRQGD